LWITQYLQAAQWVLSGWAVRFSDEACELLCKTKGKKKVTKLSTRGFARTMLSLVEAITQLVDKPVQIAVCLAELFDFVDGMQNRRMVFSAKLSSNLRQRCGR
jgi:hypothetical protein